MAVLLRVQLGCGRMDAARKAEKCVAVLNSIASRYRAAIGDGYRTDWVSAFPPGMDPAFDGSEAGRQAFTSTGRRIQGRDCPTQSPPAPLTASSIAVSLAERPERNNDINSRCRSG